MPARGPGQRAGLSRAAVLASARALIAESGLDGLSMRSLARALAVAPNSLYSHVANKTELLDELCDDVLAEVAAPPADAADPKAGVLALMTSSYDVLLRHRDLVPLFLVRQGARGPHAVALGVVLDGLLERLGVAGDAVGEARRTLIVHVIGSAAFAAGPGDASQPIDAVRARRMFEHGLRWLLTGIAGEASAARG
jgi:TetR/AcrR family transcriptional regulator, tetracycline repressor protein